VKSANIPGETGISSFSKMWPANGSVNIIPAKHKLRPVAQVVAGRVTVNSLMRIVAATYSVFQGRDDDVNATPANSTVTFMITDLGAVGAKGF